MSEDIKYRDYHLSRAEKGGEMSWVYYHKNLQGADDNRQGHGLSIESVKSEIDILMEMSHEEEVQAELDKIQEPDENDER